MEVRIGTRTSKLAQWQTQQVVNQLTAEGFSCQLINISTEGDLNRSTALHEVGGVGLFTKAIDQAMLKREIDIAVHSAKDIPTVIPEELEIVAFMKREDPREVLLARSKDVHLENFTRRWVIGTSSLRRQAFLRHHFDHVEPKSIRGNIDTRIAKLQSDEYDGIILAYAGVKRMGWEALITQKFNVQSFVPAVGQGSVAVVSHRDFAHKNYIQQLLNHHLTDIAVRCERSFLRKMEGGCHTPIFGFATTTPSTISLTAGIATLDGKKYIKESHDAPLNKHLALGENMALHILDIVNQNRINIHE